MSRPLINMQFPIFVMRYLKSLALVLSLTACSNAYGQDPLPIPQLDTGVVVDGVRMYNLEMRYGETTFVPAGSAETIGYNGSYLGPILRFVRGETVSIAVKNSLNERSTTHWHGLHVPAIMDGGPHQVIEPGTTWRATFEVINNAATYWYHPHLHTSSPADSTSTNGQVYRGLAGMILIEDQVSRQLNLPKTYGVDDIPMIVQDRAFNEDGSLSTTLVRRTGNQFLVNGAVAPTLTTHSQMIRLHILNGSNARFMNFGFSDNRSFYQVASDGGFLATPLQTNRLFLSPGARGEIVVDFSGDSGTTLSWNAYNSENPDLVSLGDRDQYDSTDYPIMTITVDGATDNPVTTIPEELTTITRLTLADTDNTDNPRPFVFADGGGGTMVINGKAMDINRIDETIELNATEVWQLGNTDDEAHPMHIHGEPFQVLSRNGASPPASEMGWKDVVMVRPNEEVLIIKNFPRYADPTFPYMYHCHVLMHEGYGMMGQFVVVDGSNSVDNSEGSTDTPILLTVTTDPNSEKRRLRFQLSRGMEVQLRLYDMLGNQVDMLANGWHNAGEHEVEITTEDLPSGTYLYKLTTPDGEAGGKMVVRK